MLFRNHLAAAFSGCALLLSAPLAFGHPSVDGPAFADQNQVLDFHLGHGCAGADSFRLEIHLPAEITSVRAVPSAWGDAEIVTNDADVPTSVVWEKADVKDADDQYYEFKLRIKVPDAPFTTLHFPVTQVCRAMDGTETTIEWAELPGGDPEADPATPLAVVPPRAAGWNKYTVGSRVEDLASYFGDAQIVWAGDAAYSANPTTMELIAAEEDVTELEAIEAGTEIWVKY